MRILVINVGSSSVKLVTELPAGTQGFKAELALGAELVEGVLASLFGPG